MADEADSKSVVGNHVRVQVPLPAVNLIPKVLEFCSGLLVKNKLDNIIVLSNKMRKSKQDLRFFVVVRLAAHVSQGCKSSYLLD